MNICHCLRNRGANNLAAFFQYLSCQTIIPNSQFVSTFYPNQKDSTFFQYPESSNLFCKLTFLFFKNKNPKKRFLWTKCHIFRFSFFSFFKGFRDQKILKSVFLILNKININSIKKNESHALHNKKIHENSFKIF